MAALVILISFRLLVNEALSVQWRQSFQSSEMYYVSNKLLLEDLFYDFVFFLFWFFFFKVIPINFPSKIENKRLFMDKLT